MAVLVLYSTVLYCTVRVRNQHIFVVVRVHYYGTGTYQGFYAISGILILLVRVTS